jgi:hypothetical protein
VEYEDESSLDVPRLREFDAIESVMPECLSEAIVEQAIHETIERE